jgi:hypothetical protein
VDQAGVSSGDGRPEKQRQQKKPDRKASRWSHEHLEGKNSGQEWRRLVLTHHTPARSSGQVGWVKRTNRQRLEAGGGFHRRNGRQREPGSAAHRDTVSILPAPHHAMTVATPSLGPRAAECATSRMQPTRDGNRNPVGLRYVFAASDRVDVGWAFVRASLGSCWSA